MVFLVIISDLENVAKARHAENDGSGHGFFWLLFLTWKVLLKPGTPRMTAQSMFFLVIISDLESVAEARHAENDGSGHDFLVNYF
jgi:hypothetical protein